MTMGDMTRPYLALALDPIHVGTGGVSAGRGGPDHRA